MSKFALRVATRLTGVTCFVPLHLNRVSDAINDERQFIVLTDAKEEAKLTDIHVGFIALNKNSVEWVRLVDEGS